MWVDYIADTGDGWNSTYGVFYTAAQPSLTFGEHHTERGSVLVLGGAVVAPETITHGFSPGEAFCDMMSGGNLGKAIVLL